MSLISALAHRIERSINQEEPPTPLILAFDNESKRLGLTPEEHIEALAAAVEFETVIWTAS